MIMKLVFNAVVLSLSLICASSRAQSDVLGTYYDINTQEYLAYGIAKGQLNISYSNGKGPFVPLYFMSITDTNNASRASKVYRACFPSDPNNHFRLEIWEGNQSVIKRYDKSGKLLSEFLFITDCTLLKPSLMTLLYCNSSSYSAADSVILKIDAAIEDYGTHLRLGKSDFYLRVRSELLEKNQIELIDAHGHGPFLLQLFSGIGRNLSDHGSSDLPTSRIQLIMPSGTTYVLIASSD